MSTKQSIISKLSKFLSKIPISPGSNAERNFVAVGYPKTGNTWIRYMLGCYIQDVYSLPTPPLFDGGEFVDLRRDGYDGPSGRFTHEPLIWTEQTAEDLSADLVVSPYRDETVVLLVRHPLDAITSHYMHMKYKKVRYPFKGTLEEFANDKVFGLDKLFKFYQLWAGELAMRAEIKIVRYEDMRADQENNLRALLDFIGAKINDASIDSAILSSSFDMMKSLEESGKAPSYSSGFKMFGDGERSNPNSFHVRKGEVGGYRSEFNKGVVDLLESRVSKEMHTCFGY